MFGFQGWLPHCVWRRRVRGTDYCWGSKCWGWWRVQCGLQPSDRWHSMIIMWIKWSYPMFILSYANAPCWRLVLVCPRLLNRPTKLQVRGLNTPLPWFDDNLFLPGHLGWSSTHLTPWPSSEICLQRGRWTYLNLFKASLARSPHSTTSFFHQELAEQSEILETVGDQDPSHFYYGQVALLATWLESPQCGVHILDLYRVLMEKPD